MDPNPLLETYSSKFYDQFTMPQLDFFWGAQEEKRGKFGIFYGVQISRIYEKIHYVKGQGLSIECVQGGEDVN